MGRLPGSMCGAARSSSATGWHAQVALEVLMQKPFSFSLPDLITFYAAWQYNTGFAMKLMLRLRSAPFTLAGVGGGVRVGGGGVGREE